MTRVRPPRIADWLLRRAIDRLDREFSMGDLHEEFVRRALSDLTAARRWYRRQVRSAWAARLARVRRAGGIVRGVLSILSGATQDLRYGLRGLRSDPVFAVLAIVTMALGIGANTAIFSLVNGVLLEPLPYADPGRLVQVWETKPDTPRRHVAPANFLDWRQQAVSFTGLTAYMSSFGNLLGVGDAERVNATIVSRNFFELLGVRLAHGGAFGFVSAGSVADPQAVLSHALWQRKFGGRADVVGATVRIDAQVYEIIGIAEPGWATPQDTDLWIAAPQDVPAPGLASSGDVTELRDSWYFRAIGRLRDGVELDAAQAEMDLIAARLRDRYPESNVDSGVILVGLHDQVVANARPILLALLAAVGFVLLAACANVAGLTLARASGRQRELAVRAALGAGRARLTRQLLAEGLLVAAVGGFLGVLLASQGVRVLVASLPTSTPRLSEVRIDAAVLLFATAAVLLTGIAFGLLPARIHANAELSAMLRDNARTGSGIRSARLREVLLAVQVGLAAALLLGAGLMVRTMSQLAAVEPGYAVDDRLVARINLPGARALPREEVVAFYNEVRAGVERLPGVGAAAFASVRPGDTGSGAGLRVENTAYDDARLGNAFWTVVAPGYFDTLGIPLLAGRDFTDADDALATPVALVNSTLARRNFPEGDAIGARINTGLDGSGTWVEVVGVVADTRNQGLTAPAEQMMFRPLAQPTRSSLDRMYLTVRSSSDLNALVTDIRSVVRQIRPRAPVDGVETLRQRLQASVADRRLTTWLLAAFAGLALALAAVGVYGVVAHLVALERREAAIRVSLGAGAAGVVWLTMRRSLAVALVGLVAGTAVAALAGGVLESQLFNVAPRDPVAIALGAAFLLLVATTASWIPARRAGRVDPAAILRES